MPQEPQERLRDSDGTILGTLYATSNGEIALHHEASGQEVVIGNDGIDLPKLGSSVDANGRNITDVGLIDADEADIDSGGTIEHGNLSATYGESTLDESDSTTWVNVPISTNRQISLIFGNLGSQGSSVGLFAAGAAGDFANNSATEIEINGGSPELRYRLNNSSLEVSTKTSGAEGETVRTYLMGGGQSNNT